MNTREKFRYMAFGGALVFLGMVGAMMSPLTAEKDKFGAIECTRLTVVDADGKTMVYLTSDVHGGLVFAFSKGLGGASLSVDEYGGCVKALGKDGQLAAMLNVGEDGGRVRAFGKDGKSAAALGIIEHGGYVSAHGKDGKSGVSLRVDEHGGRVDALGKDGKLGASLSVDEHGGSVSAFGKDGKLAAWLTITEHGGQVQVKGKGEGVAVMSINEYGNGGVSTWDKNGYRQ